MAFTMFPRLYIPFNLKTIDFVQKMYYSLLFVMAENINPLNAIGNDPLVINNNLTFKGHKRLFEQKLIGHPFEY